MKKKIIDLLFEEEVIEENSSTVEVINKIKVKDQEFEKKYAQKLMETNKPTVKKEFAADLPKKVSMTKIDVDTPKRTTSSVVQKSKSTVPYEVREPISPIFGSGSEKVFKTPQIVRENINQASKIGTIISPIYGMMLDEEVETERNKNEKVPPKIIDFNHEIFRQNQRFNENKIVEEQKTNDVEVVDIENGFNEINDDDFFDKIIDNNEEKVVTSRDISLFGDDE